MHEQHVLIVGGGEQAAQKCRLLLKTSAKIHIAAAHVCSELEDLIHSKGQRMKRGQHVYRAALPITTADCFKYAVVFIATGCVGADAAYHGVFKHQPRTPVINVVDQPHLCDALTPAIVDRDPIVVAVGSEGTAPVLTQRIRSEIESLLLPDLGWLARTAGHWRTQVAARIPKAQHRAFWEWVFKGAPWQALAQGKQNECTDLITQAIAQSGANIETKPQLIWLESAEHPVDLMTLRAVRALQQADVVVYPHTGYNGLLELARRDAERVQWQCPFAALAAKGSTAWDNACAALLAVIGDKAHVVCIQSGALPPAVVRYVHKHTGMECRSEKGVPIV